MGILKTNSIINDKKKKILQKWFTKNNQIEFKCSIDKIFMTCLFDLTNTLPFFVQVLVKENFFSSFL